MELARNSLTRPLSLLSPLIHAYAHTAPPCKPVGHQGSLDVCSFPHALAHQRFPAPGFQHCQPPPESRTTHAPERTHTFPSHGPTQYTPSRTAATHTPRSQVQPRSQVPNRGLPRRTGPSGDPRAAQGGGDSAKLCEVVLNAVPYMMLMPAAWLTASVISEECSSSFRLDADAGHVDTTSRSGSLRPRADPGLGFQSGASIAIATCDAESSSFGRIAGWLGWRMPRAASRCLALPRAIRTCRTCEGSPARPADASGKQNEARGRMRMRMTRVGG